VDDSLEHLVATYERVAAETDAHADGLVGLAFRHGWSDDLAEQIEELRHHAKTNRALADEVREGTDA
jgi:hypothetical protein